MSLPSARCGCQNCLAGWDTLVTDQAGTFSCGSRIDWVIENWEYNELEACRLVAGEQFPDACGAFCDPDSCKEPVPYRCGCEECTASVLDTLVTDGDGAYSCGSRIDWVMETYPATELAACRRVAGVEFPAVCGPKCDPDSC